MKYFITGLCGALILSLTGCETLNSMGNSLSETMKSVKLPEITPASDAAKSGNPLVAGQGDCPTVKALPDLAEITQFSDPQAPSDDKMIAKTVLDKISATCSVSGNSVAVEMGLDFTGTLGASGIKDLNGQANYTYPYFLAVVTPDGKILAKDVFALSMIYENQQITYHHQDQLRQVIPLVQGQKASEYQIMIGFQLSEDELAYNRSHPQTQAINQPLIQVK